MTSSTILVATWSNGLFVVSGEVRQELPNRALKALAPDGHGGVLAIIDERSLCRRAPDGVWSTIATTEFDLACCLAVGDVVYVGSDDARLFRVSPTGQIEQLDGFNEVAGRDKWYAGRAMVNGKLIGPPLGIRSLSATSDGAVLLANVHVGGIPRSVDGGETWQPTIDIDSDVHEVRAHPNRPETVAAAAAVGLCTSSDAGATWVVEKAGLHSSFCSAVGFAGDDILVAAAADPFAPQSALYCRRSIGGGLDEHGPLMMVAGGLPEWLDRTVHTACIAAHGSAVAVADRGGNLYFSTDTGHTWSRRADGLPPPSCVLII